MDECLNIKAEFIMSTPPITAGRNDSLWDAARVMYENNVGSILVVDEKGVLQGILTRKDILYLLATGRAVRNPRLADVMTVNPITAKPDETIGSILERMNEAKIRHMPIVDDQGKPLGVISLRDILEHIARCQRKPEMDSKS